MRQSLARRIVATLFLVVGLGVAASAVNADAAPAQSVHHVTTHASDWYW